MVEQHFIHAILIIIIKYKAIKKINQCVNKTKALKLINLNYARTNYFSVKPNVF